MRNKKRQLSEEFDSVRAGMVESLESQLKTKPYELLKENFRPTFDRLGIQQVFRVRSQLWRLKSQVRSQLEKSVEAEKHLTR